MLFRLDFQSAVPIYRQIRDQVVLAVAQGELTPGERLPTTRALAEDAGVNVMTVSKAYQLLKAEGYLVTDRRAGAVVRAPWGKGSWPVCRPDRPAETAGGRGAAGRADPGRFCGGLQSRLWRNGGLNDGDHKWIYAVDLLALRGRQLHHAAQYE